MELISDKGESWIHINEQHTEKKQRYERERYIYIFWREREREGERGFNVPSLCSLNCTVHYKYTRPEERVQISRIIKAANLSKCAA